MALFYFVVPLGCGIVCASLAPAGVNSQSLAALAGLIGGMVLTTSLAARWTRRLEVRNRGGALQALAAKETRDG
jgi:hypothetical protein